MSQMIIHILEDFEVLPDHVGAENLVLQIIGLKLDGFDLFPHLLCLNLQPVKLLGDVARAIILGTSLAKDLKQIFCFFVHLGQPVRQDLLLGGKGFHLFPLLL
ncbi:hypothetical protein [Geobacter grbiciae]|uniref:hypothetical protein n=1 Tax=Geobacter grbiciae TaxID=155042 RepID=UPI001C00CD59|nr:hypothetical protein [Geobacter grbiciae]MBT1073954.1 hypothetical protein [Geobacter grbiciae]